MRVLYASTVEQWGPLWHLRDLAPRVGQLGVDVEVICLDESIAAGFRELGVEAHAVPMRQKYDLAGAAACAPFLRRADLVHTQDPRAGLLVRAHAVARRIPVVHTYHGLPDEIAVRVRPEG